jgi:hypothetical protein
MPRWGHIGHDVGHAIASSIHPLGIEALDKHIRRDNGVLYLSITSQSAGFVGYWDHTC